jgi:hypothetical protein
MPRAAEARAWWADVEDVRERIERRRAREAGTPRRGVREVRPGGHLTLVRAESLGRDAGARDARERPRPSLAQRLEPRPDRLAAWAVLLGFALVLAAVVSAHG